MCEWRRKIVKRPLKVRVAIPGKKLLSLSLSIYLSITQSDKNQINLAKRSKS